MEAFGKSPSKQMFVMQSVSPQPSFTRLIPKAPCNLLPAACCTTPCSGPCRYDWHGGSWVYHRTGQDLWQQLQQELEQLLGQKPEM
jgi:hypothetical protein